MDEGLFQKHLRIVAKHSLQKQTVISLLQEKTGITLDDDEFLLEGKKLTLFTSSAKKNILLQKGMKDILSSEGYTLL